MEECGIVMYCDLHAHSRKHNVFIYGCENKRYVEKRLQEQVFPLMLHKNAADKVIGRDETSGVARNKSQKCPIQKKYSSCFSLNYF